MRTFEGDTKLHLGLGEVVVRASNGGVVQRYEVRDVAEEEACGGQAEEGYILWDCGEVLVLPLNVPEDGEYSVEIEAWVFEAGEKAATLQAWMPGPFYRTGDTWYRDMRDPGFNGETSGRCRRQRRVARGAYRGGRAIRGSGREVLVARDHRWRSALEVPEDEEDAGL